MKLSKEFIEQKTNELIKQADDYYYSIFSKPRSSNPKTLLDLVDQPAQQFLYKKAKNIELGWEYYTKIYNEREKCFTYRSIRVVEIEKEFLSDTFYYIQRCGDSSWHTFTASREDILTRHCIA